MDKSIRVLSRSSLAVSKLMGACKFAENEYLQENMLFDDFRGFLRVSFPIPRNRSAQVFSKCVFLSQGYGASLGCPGKSAGVQGLVGRAASALVRKVSMGSAVSSKKQP